MEVTSLIAALVAASSTAILGLVAFRLSNQGQKYSAQRAIGDLQSAMAHFRAEYPEVMRYCSRWGDDDFAVLYGRVESSDAATIVRYYSYVDIGLEFCNTTLAASSSRLISARK